MDGVYRSRRSVLVKSYRQIDDKMRPGDSMKERITKTFSAYYCKDCELFMDCVMKEYKMKYDDDVEFKIMSKESIRLDDDAVKGFFKCKIVIPMNGEAVEHNAIGYLNEIDDEDRNFGSLAFCDSFKRRKGD